MNVDIGRIMNDWPYENGQVSARRIIGEDGKEKIQLRLDLGLLQMEASGRPDGRTFDGYESLLNYYEHQLEAFRNQRGTEDGFTIDPDACEQLRAEGMMYYHRYLAEFVLEDFEGVQRDTVRNLRLFDFCQFYAREEADRLAMEQYRPYVIMMFSRARAKLALGQNQPKIALAAVRKGMDMIKQFYRRYDQEGEYASSSEVSVLQALAKEIEASIPLSPADKLKKQLARALAEERYEDAARIRDRLHDLQEQQHNARNARED